ncbi:MAG: hypothetical protein AAGM67_15755, partial [Bacteroidota bacterium]
QIEKEGEAWLIAGEKILPQKTYRVAISAFLLTGLESGLDFLTPDNPDVIAVIRPGKGDPMRDIRRVLADYLKKQ